MRGTQSIMKLAKYEAARRALAEVCSIDEVKQIRDMAVAMQCYAAQAKDASLIENATEIRRRAERRLGEMMAEMRAADAMAKPPGGSKARPRKDRVSDKPDHPALASHGIDKNLADRARKLAAMSEDKFEADMIKAKRIAVASVEGANEVVAAARAERHATKKKRRNERERQWAGKILALPSKKYGVIYADPEWQFKFYSEKGKTNTSADNHYDTSPLDEIKRRDVSSICASDCTLFLWATVPMLPHALEVMAAWGFEYKSHCVWHKNKSGTGYWFRNAHEILLVGTRAVPICNRCAAREAF
jgi:hypothetical protein